MKSRMNALFLALGALLLLASVVGAQAQAGASPGYDLSWWTVDGGGSTFSANGGYSLGGTIGQAHAGPALANSGYTLTGGFWGGGATASQYRLYLPLILRQ
ncbi:MAG: hypothetical protein KKA73_18515 [Chloroflexi bacterium]|nr:hypothetical protein [Chloroflexota bacterium]MBU1749682.1 hypothetical protein [Chloroflexota bacterium]